MARGKTKLGSVTGVTGKSKAVSLVEALRRLLPHCENNPHKVAGRLDTQHRNGEIHLLGDGVVTAPSSNPVMLGVVAHVPPVGEAFLYVQVRQALVENCSIWDGKTAESLQQHHRFWMFERESFEAHFPSAPKNRGGRPPEFVVADLLKEALAYVGVAGALPKAVEGQGSLHEKLLLRLGSRCPERVRFREIFGPIYQRIKDERSR